MPPSPFVALGDEPFISLTTFRTSGVGVSTAVWVARDGDELLVITPTESGKVKRLRNSGRVEMRACNRAGKVDPDAVTVDGTASIVESAHEVATLTEVISRKYGAEYTVIMFIERLFARRQKPRVILRIRATDAAADDGAGASGAAAA